VRVTDPAALRAWLTAQRRVYEDSPGEERRLWRAAGCLLDQIPSNDASVGADCRTPTEPAATAATAGPGAAPTVTRRRPHPASVAAGAISRTDPPPTGRGGGTPMEGAVGPVPGSPAAGAPTARSTRGATR
jgi:hypothetical protein